VSTVSKTYVLTLSQALALSCRHSSHPAHTSKNSKHHPATMTISAPPPPLDDPTVSDPLECPPLRWGLIGCGRVSHDFTQALKHLSTASVVACSARDIDRAQEFAAKHKIPRAYGNYDALLKDDDVQIVVSIATCLEIQNH